MMITLYVLFVLFCGWLNRFRGGGWPHINLPGGPALGPALILGGVALPLFGWNAAVLFAGGYVMWAAWGWGAYIDMGRWDGPPEKEIGWIDAIARRFGYGFKGDLLGWTLRQAYAAPLFILAPFAIAVSPLRAVLAYLFLCAVTVAAYALAFRLLYKNRLISPTHVAEYATGLAWGIALVWIGS